MDKHWEDVDFAAVKVSRHAQCFKFGLYFPELLPWATCCYATHPMLWHPKGHISSEVGVQQGDPLGPLFF